MPDAGDKFFQLEDLEEAKQICEQRATEERAKDLASKTTVSLDNLLDTIKQQQMMRGAETVNLAPHQRACSHVKGLLY